MDGIFGLIFECPMGESDENCPMKPIRENMIVERIEWVEKAPEFEKVQILQYHKQCLRKREKGQKE